MADIKAIMREFRLVLRKVNQLIDVTNNILAQEEVSAADCEIAVSNLEQIKPYQERLDTLIGDACTNELTDAEEKEIQKADVLPVQIAQITGKVRSIKATFEPKFEDDPRRSFVNSTLFPLNSSAWMRNKLPKINLPIFDGDEQKFLNFKSQFLRLVHNNKEVDLEDKMFYLKSSLAGKAERLIRDIPTNADNYQKAWDAIVERYEDKFLIVESHFSELFSIQRIKSTRDIRDLIDQVDSVLRSLELSGETPNGWPGIIAYFVYAKLDESTQTEWKKTVQNCSKYANWEHLRNFLKTNASAVRLLPADSTKRETKGKTAETKKSFIVSPDKTTCIACSKHHLIIECDVFQTKPVRDRAALIRQYRLCSNCFNAGHSAYQCRSHKVCKVCSRKHHTLLHFEAATPSAEKPSEPKSEAATSKQSESSKTESTSSTEATKASMKAVSDQSQVVILPSATVHFQSNAVQGFFRVLLDNCSQVTLIADSFIRRFRINTQQHPNPISVAVGGVKAAVTKQCNLTLQSKFGDFELNIVADIVPANALSYSIHNLDWNRESKELQTYNLADSAFHQKVVNIPSVDLIIGAAYLPKILLAEIKSLGELLLQKTNFGWTILGPSSESAKIPIQVLSGANQACYLSIQDIDDRLNRLFDPEEPTPHLVSTALTEEHKACEKHFEKTYEHLPNGKFSVRLPFKKSKTELSDNYNRALAYLRRSEISSSEPKSSMYKKFMIEYRELNHMRLVTSPSSCRYFLPHHAVLRPSSTTTKLRVVFNGSAITPSGKSLNDILMKGPQLQPELFDTLLNFRSYTVAFTADISRMYRCIEIHPDDRPMQSILWRENLADPVQIFELNTVTYGTAPASFIATKCLQVLAESAADPKVRSAIQSNFYMDDLLAGAPSIEEAKALQKGVHELCASAHFLLRKYQSNSVELLKSIPSELIESNLTRIIEDKDAISVLGIYWTPAEDTFRIKVPDSCIDFKAITKRKLLSEVAKIFDPLGFIAPVTIREKMFIQDLWRQGLTWDQEVPAQLVDEFRLFRSELLLLKSFSIPRPFSVKTPGRYELIGFCDSSLKAYCAVIYIRGVTKSEVESVRLVCAKTRVVPLKPLSVPKLELCGAVLLAELLDRVRNVLKIDLLHVFAFSDSQVALSWLAKSPETWKVFVANRVRKVVNFVPFDNWGYVSRSENPADIATHGCSVKTFLNADLWFNGPSFLFCPFDMSNFRMFDNNLHLEKRKPKPLCNLAVNNFDFFHEFISRFSEFNKLIRMFAYVLVYFRNLKASSKLKSPSKLEKTIRPLYLTADDLSDSESTLISYVQRSFYAKEYARLSENKPLSKRSILKAHNPFIDSKNVIRLATRLTNASVSFDRKNPIVLPSNSYYVKLLVRHIHVKYYHATRSFMFTYLSLRYHFTGSLTNVLKAELRRCVTCIRYRAESKSQIMGDLPIDRCTISRPFTVSGVDFAGPFLCKPLLTRSKVRFKIYVAVFVCFATRAVHLEIVLSLSTEDFLSALHRFVSRRGLPKVIHSDNGTNFRGASNYLDLREEKLQNYCASEGISWRFNPPRAPHRGGVWEAAVKSMKYHLVRITKDQILNYEQYSTLLHRIEAILNSRPLCYKPGSPSSVILTSGHFLIGDQITSLPEPEESPVKLSKRYEFMRRQIDSFWHSWSKDYLSQLKTRSKWHRSQPNVQKGQVVILRDDLTKPAKWDLGLIEDVFPDSHGIVRTVSVRHKNSVKKRAITSIVPLPYDEPCSSWGE